MVLVSGIIDLQTEAVGKRWVSPAQHEAVSSDTRTANYDIDSFVIDSIPLKLLNVIRDSEPVFLCIFIINSSEIVRGGKACVIGEIGSGTGARHKLQAQIIGLEKIGGVR